MLAKQPKPVQFDFITEVLMDAANATSSFRYVPQSEDRPLDIVEHVTELLRPAVEIRALSNGYHKVFMSQDKVPAEESWSSEEGLKIIYREFRDYLRSQAKDEDEAKAYIQALTKNVWPKLKPILKNSQNTAAWAKRFVTCSLFAANFIINIAEGNLALALPVAHGVLPDILGRLRPVPPSDGAFVAMLEESLRWVALRSAYVQDGLEESYDEFQLDKSKDGSDVHRIGFFGGGVDGALYARGFYLAENERAIVYDKVDCSSSLECLLNGKLADNNIEYRVGDFTEAFHDPEQERSYDVIVLSGLMPYIWKGAEPIFAKIKELLKPGGRIIFDLSVACLSYLFVGTTFPWPSREMYLPQSFDAATAAVKEICEAVDLEFVESYYEDEDCEDFCPAGIAFTLRKEA